MTVKKILKFKLERDPVLSEKAIALGRKNASNPKSARALLKRAGIIDKSGQLAAPYRTPKE